MSNPAQYIFHTAVPGVIGATESGAPLRPRCRAQANVTIAAPGATVDGLAMTAGEEFWTDLQSTPAQDGLYVWNGAATPATRSTKLPAGVSAAGLLVIPQEGTDADVVVLVTENEGAAVVGTNGLTGSLPLVTLTGVQRLTNKTLVGPVDTVDSGATGATDVVVGRTTRRTTGTLVGNGGAGVGLRDVFTAPSSTGVERLAGGVQAGLDVATNAAEEGYTALLGGYLGVGYGVLYTTAPGVVVNALEVVGGPTGTQVQLVPRGEANVMVYHRAKGSGDWVVRNGSNTGDLIRAATAVVTLGVDTTLTSTFLLRAGTNVLVGTVADKLNPVHLAHVAQAVGDVLYADSTTTMARRAIGTVGQVWTVSGGVPVWATKLGTEVVLYTNTPAPGVAVHAAIATDNAAPVTTALTNPANPRTVAVASAALYDGGDVTVVGTDQFDAAQTETITPVATTTVQGAKVFKTVTSISNAAVGAGGAITYTVVTGDKLAVKNATGAFQLPVGVGATLLLDGVTWEAVVIDAANGTFDPTTQFDGAHDYTLTCTF